VLPSSAARAVLKFATEHLRWHVFCDRSFACGLRCSLRLRLSRDLPGLWTQRPSTPSPAPASRRTTATRGRPAPSTLGTRSASNSVRMAACTSAKSATTASCDWT